MNKAFVRQLVAKSAMTAVFALFVASSGYAGPLALQNIPLYLTAHVDPNVLLNMSIETPMGAAAYNDNVGIPAGCNGRQTVGGNADIGTCYFPTTVYLGYFDSTKCYTYTGAYFHPAALATATHTCSSQWSGNFLNWLSMTAIDMFVQPMTGGNRTTDTTALTVIRRARDSNNLSWFPRKAIGSVVPSSVAPSTVTPFSSSTLYFHNYDWGFDVGTTFAKATGGSPDKGSFNASVQVCDTSISLEANCVAYGSPVYYKPEGLIQKNATSKRFAITAYTLDNVQERNGGVLRENMKYVGPKLPDGTTNSLGEYTTAGIIKNNPDSVSSGLNSGIINYVNKFSDVGYKSYDPIGELFYEAIRYYKHEGPTPEYSSGITKNSTDSKSGGFWFGNSSADWQDPIQYRCQKNFIVAINDANPWLDKQLPGTFFTTSSIMGASGSHTLTAGDYGPPSNPDPDINVTALTNTVGALEGLNGTTWTENGTWTSGTATGTNDSVGGGIGTWDNSCSDKVVANLGEVMGTCPAPQKENSYYIAGLAYYANTTDLRTDFANDRGIQNVQSFFIDTQEYNSNPLDGPKNMLWLAGKYGGFNDQLDPVTKLGDGIPQTSEWDSNGDGIPDNYVLATQPERLVAGLNAAFDFIDSKDSSASSATLNAGSISSTTRVYQARFNSGDWSGQLIAYAIDPNTGALTLPAAWDASTLIPSTRQIITTNTTGTAPYAVRFTWASLDSTRKTQLDSTAATAQLKLNYIRGDQTHETAASSPRFHPRTSKLGDIISSAPIFVGVPPFAYPDTLESASYSAFRVAQTSRTPMVYVGANDGMLHGFNASTGTEIFGFIPGSVFKNLSNLTAYPYSHNYFVDGSPNMGDVFYSSAWHTVLVGGLNQGGQGIYALDVTDPSLLASAETNATSIVKWEFTDANDADMGYSFSQPAIVRVHNGTGGRWVAIFGNGYNNTVSDGVATTSTTGAAALYIVDIQTGALIRKISTGAGTAADPTGASRPNGLATPALVDLDGDRTVDYAYAGDLFGNLWKFDLTDTNSSNWKVSYKDSGNNPLPLYKARDAAATPNAQPITVRPVVIRGPGGIGMEILFGTGKYLEATDKLTGTVQSFYGIIDANSGANTDIVSDRSQLQVQQILTTQTVDPDGSGPLPSVGIRVSTNNTLGSAHGWYMDLQDSPTATYSGERSVSGPTIRNGRVVFTTLFPDSDPCNFGGGSWIMELDAQTGSRLEQSPFDLNKDNSFSAADYVTVVVDGVSMTVPVSGTSSIEGILPEPGIVDSPKNGLQYKYTPGTSGNIQITVENPGPGGVGRQSWRQVR